MRIRCTTSHLRKIMLSIKWSIEILILPTPFISSTILRKCSMISKLNCFRPTIWSTFFSLDFPPRLKETEEILNALTMKMIENILSSTIIHLFLQGFREQLRSYPELTSSVLEKTFLQLEGSKFLEYTYNFSFFPCEEEQLQHIPVNFLREQLNVVPSSPYHSWGKSNYIENVCYIKFIVMINNNFKLMFLCIPTQLIYNHLITLF